MNAIVTIVGGEPVTTSLVIAEGVQHEHRAVLKLLRDHLTDFEDFGRVAFEVRPFETAGGTQQREVAILNEHHATLLITFMRNIGPVKEFKKRLVSEFWKMKKSAVAPALPDFNNPAAAARAWADQFEQSERLALEVKAKDEALAEAAPKVALHDALMASPATQTIQEVAKELGTGRNRLFSFLREKGVFISNGAMKNQPYQEHIDSGRFEVIPGGTWTDGDGREHRSVKTVATGKGLAYIEKLWRQATSQATPANAPDFQLRAGEDSY